ncbi:HTH-type transcriptional activator RhaR [Budvicia diplopodorum]|uniref:HTH-type transcriptional activator RhaR n=1 Tax=Budvicia diplopodorum TaxID=1119056 RepID=UPI0013577265|nr:HTH-type transcriptional activator RhaR [Budvicia diplopodorum]
MPLLKLHTSDFFFTDNHAVTVAERLPQPIFPIHNHDFYELVIVLRGNGLHIINDVPYYITCGDLFYINADDQHSYESVDSLELNNILYCRHRLSLLSDWQSLLPGDETHQEQRYWRLSVQGMSEIRPIVDALTKESMKSDKLSIQLSESLFLQLALLLKRYRHPPNSYQLADGQLLDLLMLALHAGIDKPFRLDDFCQQHSLSSRSIQTLFKQHTGVSVSHYLRQLRLCKAMAMLRQKTLHIGEISSECGFEDSNYFSAVFSRAMGVSPSEYRQRFR